SAHGHDPHLCAISKFEAPQIFPNDTSRSLRGIDQERAFRAAAQSLDADISRPGKELENLHAGKIPRQNIKQRLLDAVGCRSNRASFRSNEPPAFSFSADDAHLSVSFPGLTVGAQNNFSEVTPLFHAPMCLCSFPERVNCVDDRFYSGVIEKLEHLSKFVAGRVGGTANFQVVPENSPQIGRRIRTIDGAAGDEPPAASETGQTFAPIGSADTIDGKIDTVFSGQASHFLRQINCVVINRELESERFHPGEFFILRGAYDASCSSGRRNLERRRCDAPTDAANQYDLARDEFSLSHHQTPGGGVDERKG